MYENLFSLKSKVAAVVGGGGVLAGEMAMDQAKGPGTLQLYLYDALYLMQQADLTRRLKLSTLS